MFARLFFGVVVLSFFPGLEAETMASDTTEPIEALFEQMQLSSSAKEEIKAIVLREKSTSTGGMRRTAKQVVVDAVLDTTSGFEDTENVPREPDINSLTHEQLVELVLQIRRAVEYNTRFFRENDTKIKQLTEDIEDANTLINQQLEQQRKILNEISAQDYDTGQYQSRLPNLNSMMDRDPSFADDFGQAVKRTYPKYGTLKLVNKVGRDQAIWVNGQRHVIISGATVTLTVPREPVTVQLPGEAPTYWTFGTPHFELSLDVKPRQRITTAYAPSTMHAQAYMPAPIYGMHAPVFRVLP